MADYDFKILQPNEFECLSRDLIQARDEVYIESFTAGKDGGIDFRFALSKDKTAVIQVKRNATYASLLSELKKEVKKIQNLEVQRYYISTSVGLTPKNKTDIQKLFGADILDTADILGRDDLNNLLGLHPDIEKKYYKLWLSSTAVLESILHKRIQNWASFEMDKIKNDIHQYVINDSFDEALRILTEHQYVIISGIPGIGKTTLARMLVYDLLAKGMDEFIFISSNIDDAVEMFDENKKQVFFFDDFLGSTVFEMGEKKFDQKILSFIYKVQHTQGKLFILTTREYILSDAFIHYEKFELNHIDIAKCTLGLNHYTKQIRAAILYNHLADAQLPDQYIETLLENGNYKQLINHTNFNPRVIETFINDKVWETVEPKDFMDKLMSFFDSPLSVWEKAFEKLEITTRYILLVLATMPVPVRVDDWRTAFEHFRQKHSAKLGLQCDEQKWMEAIKVLEDCFVITDRLDGGLIVKLYNPSVRDFLSAYIAAHSETCSLLISGLYYTEQLYSMFSDWKWFNHQLYTGASYVILGEDKLDLVKEAFLWLHESKRKCKLQRSNRLLNVIESFDEFVYLQEMLRYFPQLCRNNPGLIEQFVTEKMFTDEDYDIADRIRLLKSIKLDYCNGIKPQLIIEEMDDDLECVEDYVSFIEVVDFFEVKEYLDNEDFKNRFYENTSREIDQASSDTDIDAIKVNLNIISMKFPDWDLDFEEEIEYQKMKLSEEDYEREDWEREKGDDSQIDEDIMINEMFTSLRIKED